MKNICFLVKMIFFILVISSCGETGDNGKKEIKKATEGADDKLPKITPLDKALVDDDVDAFNASLGEASLDQANKKGKPLIQDIIENQKIKILASLLKDGKIDKKYKDSKGMNLLHLAANAPKSVKTILGKLSADEAKELVNETYLENIADVAKLPKTPLILAIDRDNAESLKQFLEINGADIHAEHRTRKEYVKQLSPLNTAARDNRVASYPILLKTKPDEKNLRASISYAVANNHAAIVKEFSKTEAYTPEEKKKIIEDAIFETEGETFLTIALEKRAESALAELLELSKAIGANLFKITEDVGINYFLDKAAWTNAKIVNNLYKEKPNLFELNDAKYGKQLVHFAAGAGKVDIIKLICSSDKDRCIAPDKKGLTPAHYAAMYSQLEVLEALFELNNNIFNILDHNNVGPIWFIANREDDAEVAEYLLEHSKAGTINRCSNDGRSPLHNAVYWDLPKVVGAFGGKRFKGKVDFGLQCGANKNTPLHEAAEPLYVCNAKEPEKTLVELLKYLTKEQINAKNAWAKTALDLIPNDGKDYNIKKRVAIEAALAR